VMAEGVYIPADDLPQVKNAKGLMAEAVVLSASGKYRQAIAKYDEALPLVTGLEADLAKRLTGKIRSAILADLKEIVKALLKEALDLNRVKDFKGALARIDEASDLVGKYEMRDPGLVGQIDNAYQQTRQANFQVLVAEGDRQLGAGHDDKALAAYDRALSFSRLNKLESGNAETISRIGESVKVARVRELLAKGDDSFHHSRWREAIAAYNTALNLYRESKLKRELPAYDRAVANLGKARRAAALEDLHQAEIEAGRYFVAGAWDKAKTAYDRLLALVDRSGYSKDPDFVKVRHAAETRLGKVDERLLVGAKRDYLLAHHRAILRKAFNLQGEVAFLNPEVVYLTEDGNGMKYSITARSYERRGTEGKYTIYEVLYAYNRQSGDWVLLNQNKSSKVSSGR